MASIFRHQDRWRASVFKYGQRASKVFDTKREAQAWALKKEDELERLKGSHGKTFGDATARYLKTVSKDKDPEWEKRRLDAMTEFFGADTKLVRITSDTVGKWRDKRLETVTGSTVQREANLLRHMFNVAADEWKWLDSNPFKGVRLPDENIPRSQVWTWKLIYRVLRSDRGRQTGEVVRAFHVALHTGLRLAEVLGATYDAPRKVIVLGKTKTTRPGVKVEVPVTRRAARMMPRLLGPGFTVGPDMASALFAKLAKQLLIQGLTFHDARATALTLLSRRMDVMTLAKISRHKDLGILLKVYYRETAEQISARL